MSIATASAPLRPGMPPLPVRWRSLPVDAKGYPVPFFIAWINGVPDHRVSDQAKVRRAITGKLCHLCGQPLGDVFSFVIGPMCGITRVAADAPDHLECACFAAQVCPHLSRPQAKRRTTNVPDNVTISATGLSRNPGCALVWTTKTFERVKDPTPGHGGWLWRLGDPVRLDGFCEGRSATVDEVLASVNSGFPILEAAEVAAHGKRGGWALQAMRDKFLTLLHTATT